MIRPNPDLTDEHCWISDVVGLDIRSVSNALSKVIAGVEYEVVKNEQAKPLTTKTAA